MKKNFICLVILVFTEICFQNSVCAQSTGTSNNPASRVVEDGGTGVFSAIMYNYS